MTHQTANFKAKYGVSNRDVATILKLDALEVKNRLERDTFTGEQNELMRKVALVITRTVKEARLLEDHAPMIQVLDHKIERLEIELKQVKAENEQLKSKHYKTYKKDDISCLAENHTKERRNLLSVAEKVSEKRQMQI